MAELGDILLYFHPVEFELLNFPLISWKKGNDIRKLFRIEVYSYGGSSAPRILLQDIFLVWVSRASGL